MSINRIFIVALILITTVASSAYGQFEQQKRIRERMNQSIRASREEEERNRRLEEESRLPAPKPAVMNVDVQMVLSTRDLKTFAEAKAAEAKRVMDGEPLWMYVKFKTKLGDYVLTTRSPEDREKLLYTLWLDIAPRGDVAALQQYTLQFSKEDLAATELKINLAPGAFGSNKSLPIFLMTTGAAKSGVWNNELRLTNSTSIPRSLTDNLAATPVVIDLSQAAGKYNRMVSEYDSIILRGSTDVKQLPFAGSFFSDPLKNSVATKLAAENIQPLKIYFSGDRPEEFATFAPVMKKTRRVFATFTYRQNESCFYGVAKIVETYDFLQQKYSEAEIEIQKDLPVGCTEVN